MSHPGHTKFSSCIILTEPGKFSTRCTAAQLGVGVEAKVCQFFLQQPLGFGKALLRVIDMSSCKALKLAVLAIVDILYIGMMLGWTDGTEFLYGRSSKILVTWERT